jgi:hypothetical protein
MGKTYRERPRNIPFLAWLKTKSCACCGQRKGIEAAHIGTTESAKQKAFGQKFPDWESIPLCILDHKEGKRSIHKMGATNFFEYWGMDRDGIIALYQQKYREETGLEPIVTKEEAVCS